MMGRLLQGGWALFRAMLRGRPKYLILHVTSACNARCRMCFNWQGMRERAETAGPSPEKLERLAKSLGVLPQLTFSGGEPLLRRDLERIALGFYSHAGTRFMTVPTNALLPARVREFASFFLKECPGAYLSFCLPFHGLGSEFDEMLGVEGAFERFNETYEVIREIRGHASNVSCQLNCVVSRFNHERCRAIIDTALEDYADAGFGLSFARGETHEPDAVDFPLESYLDAVQYLASRRRGAGSNPFSVIHAAMIAFIPDTIAGVVRSEIEDLDCRAGRNLLVVYENGDVFPCEQIDVVQGAKPPEEHCSRPDTWRLGNLDDFGYDLAALLESPHAREVIEWIDSNPCACTWECAIFSRTAHAVPRFPKLLYNAARCARR